MTQSFFSFNFGHNVFNHYVFFVMTSCFVNGTILIRFFSFFFLFVSGTGLYFVSGSILKDRIVFVPFVVVYKSQTTKNKIVFFLNSSFYYIFHYFLFCFFLHCYLLHVCFFEHFSLFLFVFSCYFFFCAFWFSLLEKQVFHFSLVKRQTLDSIFLSVFLVFGCFVVLCCLDCVFELISS